MRDFFKNLVGGKPGDPDASGVSAELQADPRWRRVHNREWQCLCCGDNFHGLPDLACDRPQYWSGKEPPQRNPGKLPGSDFLALDFCVVDGEHYFVRCMLEIAIIGGGGARFGYGVWSSLSERNFNIYWHGFDHDDYEDDGPWFGWLANNLNGYPETLSLKCQVYPQQNNQRPQIELEETDHPLAVEYHSGMTFDRALELHALNGHDLKTALTD